MQQATLSSPGVPFSPDTGLETNGSAALNRFGFAGLRQGTLFLLVAAVLWAAPSLWHLVQQQWAIGQDGQLLIILPIAAWLIYRNWPRDLDLRPGNTVVAATALAALIAIHLMSVLLQFLFTEMLAVYAGGLVVLYAIGGVSLCRRLWFPLLFVLTTVPLPSFIIAPATRDLKLLVALTSVDILSLLGFEVARSGTSIFIDQYELVTEAACSGVNSIGSLTAIGLLFAYLRHGAPRRVILLAIVAVPVALIANIVRVVILGALVSWFGVYILDTSIHPLTGMLMFAIAAFLLVAIDRAVPLLEPVGRWFGRERKAR